MSHSHHHHGHPHGHEHGTHGHHAYAHAPRALAAAPTFSLLRLSVWQRMAGAAGLLAALWLMVLGVME